MKDIPDKSVDMILCDLPYNTSKRKTTWNTWDCEIDLDKLWNEYNRIITDNGAIVLFAQGLFSAQLIMSNYKDYKYEWIWRKEQGTGFLNAKRMPLKNHENILVFYKKQPVYNPQMREGKPYTTTKGSKSSNYCKSDKIVTTTNNGERYYLNPNEENLKVKALSLLDTVEYRLYSKGAAVPEWIGAYTIILEGKMTIEINAAYLSIDGNYRAVKEYTPNTISKVIDLLISSDGIELPDEYFNQ